MRFVTYHARIGHLDLQRERIVKLWIMRQEGVEPVEEDIQGIYVPALTPLPYNYPMAPGAYPFRRHGVKPLLQEYSRVCVTG
jgi:hypothetical protein